MSYRLEVGEALPAGLKRIAREQIDRAIDELTHPPDGDRDEGVHEARKRFKKIRAVLRLVRDEIGEDVYKPENVCYRDAGRRLSDVRDSFVRIETLDLLTDHFSDQLSSGAFEDIRQKLVEMHQSTRERMLQEEGRMEEVAETIREARSRMDGWPILHDDFSALHDGMRRVYKRGHNRLAEAREAPSPEVFHEWRKRVKYLWYHTRILNPLWPDLLEELADQIHDLSDYLGDDHDLVQLRWGIEEHPEIFGDGDSNELEALFALIARYRADLEAAAQSVGERIYVEQPDLFVERMGGYWKVWRRAQDVRVRVVPDVIE